jgi:hypothetical protein
MTEALTELAGIVLQDDGNHPAPSISRTVGITPRQDLRVGEWAPGQGKVVSRTQGHAIPAEEQSGGCNEPVPSDCHHQT